MIGFLTLGMVKGGITRDAFTQEVAATDSRHLGGLASPIGTDGCVVVSAALSACGECCGVSSACL